MFKVKDHALQMVTPISIHSIISFPISSDNVSKVNNTSCVALCIGLLSATAMNSYKNNNITNQEGVI